MEQTVSLERLQQMTVGDVAALPIADLIRLQQEVVTITTRMKAINDLLNGAFARRFGDLANNLRSEAGKTTGIVHFQDGLFEITADMPKKVEWDQGKLAGIVQTIREAGDDPAQYVETTLEVSERKYTAWPDNIRRVFEPARTLKPGRQTFKISPAKEVA
ncbi:MAG: hypothetical protein HQM06_13365 [Magnetococcales bacterium]|nr:hypothetical protein [Magnetococcales bacterium]